MLTTVSVLVCRIGESSQMAHYCKVDTDQVPTEATVVVR